MKKIIWFLFIVGLVFVATNANAIPAFARKTNLACSACHTAWPMLNALGRTYKEHGFRMGTGEMPGKAISRNLKWDEKLPISVEMVGRPYDKKDSGEIKNRAVHEVELMVAGPMGEKFSGFFEIEAEDEGVNGIGFETGIPAAALTYNHSEAVNVELSWGSNAWFDPYNTYSGNRRMTRGTNAVIDQSFGGADNGGNLKSSRQNIALHGRPVPKLFYGLALSGNSGDAEGEEGNTVTARVAFDVMPSLTIGILHMSGTAQATSTSALYEIDQGTGLVTLTPATSTPERDYRRTAIDVQANVSNVAINAAFLQATDDNVAATAEVKNNAYYVQALYSIKGDGRILWAPLFRYDVYEKLDGAEEISELSLGMNYYLTENVRCMIEYWDRSGDGSTADDDRLTLQVYAAF